MSEQEPERMSPEELLIKMIKFESRVGNFDHLDDPDVLFEEPSPFGKPLGRVPMGTLAEVAGKDVAQPIYDKIHEARVREQKAAAKILGFWRGH